MSSNSRNHTSTRSGFMDIFSLKLNTADRSSADRCSANLFVEDLATMLCGVGAVDLARRVRRVCAHRAVKSNVLFSTCRTHRRRRAQRRVTPLCARLSRPRNRTTTAWDAFVDRTWHIQQLHAARTHTILSNVPQVICKYVYEVCVYVCKKYVSSQNNYPNWSDFVLIDRPKCEAEA